MCVDPRAKVESSKSRKERNACRATLMNRMKDERCGARKPVEKRDRKDWRVQVYGGCVPKCVMREWGRHDRNGTLGVNELSGLIEIIYTTKP